MHGPDDSCYLFQTRDKALSYKLLPISPLAKQGVATLPTTAGIRWTTRGEHLTPFIRLQPQKLFKLSKYN